MTNIIWFKNCSLKNKMKVGGKNASLGILYKLKEDINISNGFAITTDVYDLFLENNKLNKLIHNELLNINTNTNINDIEIISNKIKKLIIESDFDINTHNEIIEHYNKLRNEYNNNIEIAVRSSAVAEDLPSASFAGQLDTFLNITDEINLINSIKACYASLFNIHVISYRKDKNIPYENIKMSVSIQKMIRSDIGSSGVSFSIDTETGYDKSIIINSAFGLGELVVSGNIVPDEFIIDKRALINNLDPILKKKKGDKNIKMIYSDNKNEKVKIINNNNNLLSLNDNQVKELANNIILLEKYYSNIYNKKIYIDVEWALDGLDNKLYIIQVRPETIFSNNKSNELIRYNISKNNNNILLLEGISVGNKVSTGKVKILHNSYQHKEFNKGDILVTDITTPDWEPIMKIASGIITNKGGRTCHAAIVAREIGVNCIVGCKKGTEILKNNQEITVSCCEGEIGKIYDGFLKYTKNILKINNDIKLPVKLMMNIANPDNTFSNSLLPNNGVGLVRIEFIINNYIGIHPNTIINYNNKELNNNNNFLVIKDKINHKIKCNNLTDFFISELSKGISKIASSFYPEDVIVRLSDFKSNEYKNLLGGDIFEPNEENPMIGWRGASRYYSKDFEKAFELECKALKYARDKMGMTNIIIMIPFCRTPEECKIVISLMEKYGLKRGVNNLKIYIMCEIPSNVIEADRFAPLIDGVSIGGNDLLQLTLGIDRDSERVSYLSDYNNISYQRLIIKAIKDYKKYNIKVGFCGQQPSDDINFAKFLINNGIDSISVTPDSILNTLNIIKNYSLE